jgi:putative ABC transport system substrate-binding protein
MRRIGLAVVLAVSLGLVPLAGEAQQPGKMPRIGVFGSAITPDGLEAFQQGLRDFGYVEGRNIVIERVQSPSDLAHRAAELVSRKVDVIVALSTSTATAARDTVTTIPVVFVTFADPVRVGLVDSLARPGRNMTGLTLMAGELAGKRLQLLREAVPRVARVAVLRNPSNRDTEEQLEETQSAARSLGLQLELHAATAPGELPAAFSPAEPRAGFTKL